MPSINFCENCSIEFKVKHDADPEFFSVSYCPFCSSELDNDEQYHFDEGEEE